MRKKGSGAVGGARGPKKGFWGPKGIKMGCKHFISIQLQFLHLFQGFGEV